MSGALYPLPLLSALHDRGESWTPATSSRRDTGRPTRAANLAMRVNFCVLADIGRLDVMQWLNGVDFDDLCAAFDPETTETTVEGIPVRARTSPPVAEMT